MSEGASRLPFLRKQSPPRLHQRQTAAEGPVGVEPGASTVATVEPAVGQPLAPVTVAEPPPPGRHGTLASAAGGASPTARRRRVWALGGVYVVAELFYLWTAVSGGQPLRFGGRQSDYYNQLTNGFLRGHLSIPTLPPRGLLALPNPYSPSDNGQYLARFLDLSLYHGHFYLSWGPTPVVTLFLPWRILHIGGLPQNLAIWIYCSIGLAFTLLLLRLLVEEYLPSARTWQLSLGAVALATGSVAPFLLRSPSVYEVAIASSYCFAMAGLYLLARGGLAGRWRPWPLAVGSLCIGLSAGGHIDMVVLGVVPLALAVVRMRQHPSGWRGRALLAGPVLGPFILVGVLLALYNQLRFGSIFEYGEHYQLAGGWDQQQIPGYRLGYVPPGLYYYLAAPARFTLAFPYFALVPPPGYPGTVPGTYLGVEPVGGLLAMAPIALVLFLSPVVLRRRAPRELAIGLGLLTLAGFVLAAVIAFAIWGATLRYEADFATLLLLPAVLVWMLLSESTPARRRIAKVLGTMAIVFGALVGVAVSITGYHDELAAAEPSTYRAIESAMSPFPTFVTMLLGHPVLTGAQPSYEAKYGDVSYTTIGVSAGFSFNLMRDWVELDVISPGGGTWDLRATADRTSSTPTGRDAVDLVVHNGDVTKAFHYGPGRHTTPIRLSQGLNRVIVYAATPGHPGIAATSPVLTVGDISFVRPS